VAMRGSPLGVGTDIAGSIRIPSICNGTYGFKPSASRIPYGGQTSSGRPGSPGFPACAGPLANSFRDLELFTSAVISAQPRNLDPVCLGIPWRQVQKKDHLVLGVVGGDPNYPLHPPVIRALGSAVSKLTAAGHNVKILSDTPSIDDACQVAFKFFALDNTNVCMQHIQRSGEPPIYSLRTSGPDYSDHKFTLEELFDLNFARLEFVAAWEKFGSRTNWMLLSCLGPLIPQSHTIRTVIRHILCYGTWWT
jgi:amidase